MMTMIYVLKTDHDARVAFTSEKKAIEYVEKTYPTHTGEKNGKSLTWTHPAGVTVSITAVGLV